MDHFSQTKPPLRLWKSSMSALVPREAANAMLASEKTLELLRWLQPTSCPDETFWTTVAGSPCAIFLFLRVFSHNKIEIITNN